MQRGAGLRFDEPDVGTVDESIRVNVFAEIGRGHAFARLRLGLPDIAGIHEAVSRRVAYQHAY